MLVGSKVIATITCKPCCPRGTARCRCKFWCTVYSL